MAKPAKTWDRIRNGSRNVDFRDLLRLAEGFGFRLVRTRGSHHILAHPEVPELLNLQPDGAKAKPYQVRQLEALVAQYGLKLEDGR